MINFEEEINGAMDAMDIVKDELKKKKNLLGRVNLLEEVNGALHHLQCLKCMMKRYGHI